jgi:hypothetical protein
MRLVLIVRMVAWLAAPSTAIQVLSTSANWQEVQPESGACLSPAFLPTAHLQDFTFCLR